MSNALQGGEYSWGLAGIDRSEIVFDQSQLELTSHHDRRNINISGEVNKLN